MIDRNATEVLGSILDQATNVERWEAEAKCADCRSRESCPFRENATLLRDLAHRRNLIAILRRGELACGQRWNFRDAFSLVAELLVGQWSDFEDCPHPCKWVHKHAAAAASTPESSSILTLARRLYFNSLFPSNSIRDTVSAFLKQHTDNSSLKPLTKNLLAEIRRGDGLASSKPIRETLLRDYSRLDPALCTPKDKSHELRILEDAFCQSAEQGLVQYGSSPPSPIAYRSLLLFQSAEQECEELLRDSDSAMLGSCISLLRSVGCMMAKRSFGVLFGHHSLEEHLVEYEAALRSPDRLSAVRAALQSLLGEADPGFNMLEILGQPTAEKRPRVTLSAQPPGIRPVAAPTGNESSPGHDVPCIEFSNLDYRIPLTFDFFMAIRLRKEGCAGSSLPANVRAAIDRVRHRIAGDLCRSEELFADGRTSVRIASQFQIVLSKVGERPTLKRE
ncbi:hypothetical protein KQI84_08615 [bacterium]|nr:hypothetical protein [bacterium]